MTKLGNEVCIVRLIYTVIYRAGLNVYVVRKSARYIRSDNMCCIEFVYDVYVYVDVSDVYTSNI